MTHPIDKDAIIKNLQDRNQLLQKPTMPGENPGAETEGTEMAPLDGDMLTAFRRAKEYALGKRRQTLSTLIEEIKVSKLYNTAYIQLAPNLTAGEKETLCSLLNEELGGVYAYTDAKIDRLIIDIKPAMLVRLNKYAAENRVSRQEAILELVELGLASQRR